MFQNIIIHQETPEEHEIHQKRIFAIWGVGGGAKSKPSSFIKSKPGFLEI